MKAVDFAFWLQGHFELNPGETTLSPKQAQQVLEKAATVQAGSGDAEAKAQGFVSYTQGMLFAVSQGAADPEFLGKVTQQLKTSLSDLFIHAIDPSLPGDQEALRNKHRPDKPGGLVAMC